MDSTVNPPKETGQCAVCWGSFKIQMKNGTVHKHGHGDANGSHCSGSYKPPACNSQQPNASSIPTSNPANRNSVPTTSTAAAQDLTLITVDSGSHRLVIQSGWVWWHAFLRQLVPTALSCSQHSWRTLSSHRTIMSLWTTVSYLEASSWQSKKEAAKTRNLASTINKTVAAWKSDLSATTVCDKTQHRMIHRSAED